VQGDAGHPGEQGSGPKKNNGKKWRAEEEEERHKGQLAKKTALLIKKTSVQICKPVAFTNLRHHLKLDKSKNLCYSQYYVYV
jgi:hypothetical protein